MALNLSGLPTVPLRIIFLVMFCLVTCMFTIETNVSVRKRGKTNDKASTTTLWLGQAYLLSNYFVVLLGIWCENDKISPVPVQLFFFGMIYTLLNDIISLGLTFESWKFVSSRNGYLNTFNFNAACAIILVLIKPVFSLFIYKEWTFRMNSDEGHSTAPNASNYERLDQNTGYGSGYGAKGEHQAPPQYQPPSQPFP